MEPQAWPAWWFMALPFALVWVVCWGIQVRCFDDERWPNLFMVLALYGLGFWVNEAVSWPTSPFWIVIVVGYLAWGVASGNWQRACEKRAYEKLPKRDGGSKRYVI